MKPCIVGSAAVKLITQVCAKCLQAPLRHCRHTSASASISIHVTSTARLCNVRPSSMLVSVEAIYSAFYSSSTCMRLLYRKHHQHQLHSQLLYTVGFSHSSRIAPRTTGDGRSMSPLHAIPLPIVIDSVRSLVPIIRRFVRRWWCRVQCSQFTISYKPTALHPSRYVSLNGKLCVRVESRTAAHNCLINSRNHAG